MTINLAQCRETRAICLRTKIYSANSRTFKRSKVNKLLRSEGVERGSGILTFNISLVRNGKVSAEYKAPAERHLQFLKRASMMAIQQTK
jgi:hypothetical protein